MTSAVWIQHVFFCYGIGGVLDRIPAQPLDCQSQLSAREFSKGPLDARVSSFSNPARWWWLRQVWHGNPGAGIVGRGREGSPPVAGVALHGQDTEGAAPLLAFPPLASQDKIHDLKEKREP